MELDHEDQATHAVVVTATDPSNFTDTVDVTITVEDVDETPEITGPATVEREEGDGTDAATFVASDPDDKGIEWRLGGTDSEDFDLSGGVLTFKAVPDFEAPDDSNGDNRYLVTIQAKEQGDGTSVARVNATVRVTNADEDGTLAPVSPAQRVGYEIELELEDPDGVSSIQEWNWERSADRTNWSAVQGVNSSVYAPSTGDTNRYLRTTVFYRNRHGPGKSAQFVSNFIREIRSVPETPSAPSVSAGARSLVVTWAAPQAHPAITGYVVRHRESVSSEPWTESEVPGNSLRHTITGLSAGTAYEVEISAENAEGSSNWSEPATGTPSAGGGGGGGGGGSPPVVTDDACLDELGALAGTATIRGTWASDCESSQSGRGYARYYSFTVAAETAVTIDMASSVDTYLYLRQGSATSGTALSENDDIESGNTNSQIAANLEAGTYTIEATTYAEETTGSFSLNVSGSGGSQTPVATGCSPAALTLPATGVSGSWADDCESSVSGRGYARYHSFTLSDNGEVTIELTSGVDTYLYLREGSATSRTSLHENDDMESGNTNSRIVATLSPGTYTIEATTYAEETTGSFSLNVSGSGGSQTPVATGCSPAALTLPATGVSGSWASDCESSVSGRGYARYYSFSLSENADVTINLESSVDTYLYLREGNATSGTSLHDNDDMESGNTNSRIVATLSPGTYTIEATTYAEESTGSFSLNVGTSGGTEAPVAT